MEEMFSFLIDLLLLYMLNLYKYSLHYKYMNLALHNHIYSLHHQNQLHSHMLDLPQKLILSRVIKSYQIQFKNDKRDGVGIQTNDNGSTLQGTWKNDEQHGIIIYTSASGRVVKLDKVKGRTKNVTTIKKVKEIDKLQNRKIKDNDPEFQKFVKDYLKRNLIIRMLYQLHNVEWVFIWL